MNLASLNPPQRSAVEQINGPLMILAGAGTGKTKVITTRIVHMIHQGIAPEHIVAMTFTNKAAREMKERIEHTLGRKPRGLFVGTFHSFCLMILRQFCAEVGLDKNFTLIGTSEQLQFVSKALEEKGWQGLYKADALLARISNAKNSLLLPDEVPIGPHNHPYFHDHDPQTLVAVYDHYERQLKLNRAIDFDDCILKVVKLFQNHPEIRDACHRRYTHFLVDEFQDTNFAQLSVIEHLAEKSQNICVVGDDDQSIYSWRGALTATLEKFESTFKNTRLIKLEQNYRCTNVILNAANKVIKNNQGRKEKTLWSASNKQHHIMVGILPDDQQEARWIAKKIFALLGQGHQPRDIAILYRANTQSKALEIAMREFSIRYKVFGGNSFFERKEVKDFLSYFKLSFQVHDRMAFWRIINTPHRGIGLKTLEKIEAIARDKDVSPFTAMQAPELEVSSSIRAALDEFAATFTQIHNQPVNGPEDLLARGEQIIKTFQLENDIRQKTTHDGSRLRKLENLRKLPQWVKKMSDSYIEEHGQFDVRSFLDQICLNDDGRSSDENLDGNYVSLMTIHAAKGLEFPAVFLCGAEEDLLPHKNSVTSDLGLQEERRLFYVAVTRAKEKLFISHTRERFSSFQKTFRKPSRFLTEMPDEGVVTEDCTEHKEESLEDKKTRNLGRLTDLRKSLKEGFGVKA